MSMLTLLGGAPFQPLDDTGVIVPGGKLLFYEAGTETLQDTFTDAQGLIVADNPVILDGNGRASIYLLTTPAYDITFFDADDVLIWFQPNVIANAPAS